MKILDFNERIKDSILIADGAKSGERAESRPDLP